MQDLLLYADIYDNICDSVRRVFFPKEKKHFSIAIMNRRKEVSQLYDVKIVMVTQCLKHIPVDVFRSLSLVGESEIGHCIDLRGDQYSQMRHIPWEKYIQGLRGKSKSGGSQISKVVLTQNDIMWGSQHAKHVQSELSPWLIRGVNQSIQVR